MSFKVGFPLAGTKLVPSWKLIGPLNKVVRSLSNDSIMLSSLPCDVSDRASPKINPIHELSLSFRSDKFGPTQLNSGSK